MARTKLRWLLPIAAGVILSFAFIYWIGQGIRFGDKPWGVGFWDCVYMSMVTFTTLGYGDFLPVGYGKIAAICEVACGVFCAGMIIARLTSATQSYRLDQLYARDAQDKFERFLVDLRDLRDRYRNTTSGQPALVRRGLGSLHHEGQMLLTRIRDFASFEINQGDLLRQMPTGPAARVMRSCCQIAALVEKTANQPTSRASQKQRQMAIRLIQQMEELGNLFSANCDDASIRFEASKLKKKCTTLQSSLSSTVQRVAKLYSK